MIVTRGGKEYEPSADAAIIAPRQKDMSHAAFVLWETMIGLQLERRQAVEKWERVRSLYEKADANRNHPNVNRIWSRIEALESQMFTNQVSFLNLEEVARREWGNMTGTDKALEELDLMYNNGCGDPLPPLWTHKLGLTSVWIPQFPMSTTALQFASPALIRVYQGGRR